MQRTLQRPGLRHPVPSVRASPLLRQVQHLRLRLLILLRTLISTSMWVCLSEDPFLNCTAWINLRYRFPISKSPPISDALLFLLARVLQHRTVRYSYTIRVGNIILLLLRRAKRDHYLCCLTVAHNRTCSSVWEGFSPTSGLAINYWVHEVVYCIAVDNAPMCCVRYFSKGVLIATSRRHAISKSFFWINDIFNFLLLNVVQYQNCEIRQNNI